MDNKNEIAHMYKLWNWIYKCDRCGQKYPHWMINEKDWKKGVKKLNPRGAFGPKKHICKACFEWYNPNPKYMTVDEYIAEHDRRISKTPEKKAELKELLEEVWTLPAQYATPEIYKERTAGLRTILEEHGQE